MSKLPTVVPRDQQQAMRITDALRNRETKGTAEVLRQQADFNQGCKARVTPASSVTLASFFSSGHRQEEEGLFSNENLEISLHPQAVLRGLVQISLSSWFAIHFQAFSFLEKRVFSHSSMS